MNNRYIYKLLPLIITFYFLGCSNDETIEFTLTTISSPTEGGSISPAEGKFDAGEEIKLTATPSDGYYLINWSGAITGDENPRTVTMHSDKEITAFFGLLDSDGDGVPDNTDQCNDTPPGEAVNESGCSESQVDSDGDGVNNDVDECPQTPEGETVDETGCSSAQKDMDGDGVTNDEDRCNDTPEGESVDENGCSTSQVDSDGDGIYDDKDQCKDTPEGETVDEEGCSESQKDGDGDGVPDSADNCPDTPKDEETDENGCSASQVDTDGDGISDDADQCPETPTGEAVDAEGCSDSQKDSDGDGVADDLDQCADTPKEDTVDEQGCTVVQLTYVPDDAFEQNLIDLGYDDVLDDYVITENIINVQEISIGYTPTGYYEVSDLTGLEDFESLTHLSLEGAKLTSFDIKKYRNLRSLSFWQVRLNAPFIIDDTQLEYIGLDLSGPDLALITNNDKLANISVSDYAKFETFEISNNPLIKDILGFEDVYAENMIFSNNKNFTQFFCVGCNFENLNFSNNDSLVSIGLDFTGAHVKNFQLSNNPRLTRLNVTASVDLVSLDIRDSNILQLDVSQNLFLTTLDVSGSPLTCIKVNQDQLDNIPEGWLKDAEDTYSLTCE